MATHSSPDLDAVASVWLLKRFDEQHFGRAEVRFVMAGDRVSPVLLEELGISNEEVEHVDTGLSRFDHHSERLALAPVSAASLVRDYLIELHPELAEDKALERMVKFVVEVDHFGEIEWPEPNSDRYLFMLDEILKFLKTTGETDEQVVGFGTRALESVYSAFGARVAAEREVEEKGKEFETIWGKGLGLLTSNDASMKYAQKAGYQVVVRKDPELGNVRIKAVPDKNIDLSEVYEKISGRDPQASWYFHPARTMLLNGSQKGQHKVPSQLSLAEVIEILESVKETRK